MTDRKQPYSLPGSPVDGLSGFDACTAFLGALYPDAGSVWVAGFHDIAQASWFGGRGLAGVRARLDRQDVDASEADLYFCIGDLRADAKGRHVGEIAGQRLLIADDIGTKVDRRAWDARIAMGCPEPTFCIETSPGNETWGWLLAGDPTTPERFEELALIRAHMVEQVLTDDVMDATRYIRLPWGWNSKPKYRADGAELAEAPDVRLVGWNPGAVDLDALGRVIVPGGPAWRGAVMPVASLTSAQLGVLAGGGGLERTASMADPDPIIQMAEVVGLQPRQARQGVVDALCPNMGAHSDRPETGFAFLGRGLAQCQHASCQGLRSGDFRRMIEDEYENQMAGRIALGLELPDDLPASAGVFMARADFARHGVTFDPTGATSEGADPDAEAMASRMAERSHARELDRDAALSGLLERFVWVNPAMAFFDTQHRTLLTKEQFDNHPDVLPHFPVGLSGQKRASNVVLNAPKLMSAFGLAYRPGADGAIVIEQDENGVRREHANMWVRSRIGRRKGSPDAWLELSDHLIPAMDFREFAFDRMAFHIQKPDVRSPIVPVIQGGQGVGKDAWFDPFLEIIGKGNTEMVSMARLESPFNEWQRRAIVVLPELKLSGNGKLYNALKDWTGSGSKRITINEKFQRPYTIRPVANFFAFTNHLDAVAGMEADDRRIAAYASPAVPKPKAWYQRIITEIMSVEGLEKLHEFLATRDISNFNPHAPAPDGSGSKALMLADSLPPAAAWVVEECGAGGRYEDRVFLTLNEVEAAAQNTGLQQVKNSASSRIIRDGLLAAGCVSTERQVKAGSSRRRIWFGPASTPEHRRAVENLTPAEIGELAQKDLEASRERAAKAAADALTEVAKDQNKPTD